MEAILHQRFITERNFTKIFQAEKRNKKDEDAGHTPLEEKWNDFIDFYENLYNSERTEDYQPLDALKEQVKHHVVELEKDSETSEVEGAIASLPSKSTPGIDGIPNKFYKLYKKTMAKIFQCHVQGMMDGEKIPNEMKEHCVPPLQERWPWWAEELEAGDSCSLRYEDYY